MASKPESCGKPRVLLAACTLSPGNGGICRVARLMARVLAGEREAGNLEAEAIALSDPEPVADLGIPVTTARNSRLEFVWNIYRAARTHSHFIYDFQGISRAHSRLPFWRRPRLTFIHGVEVWETESEQRARSARAADYLLSNTAYTIRRANQSHGGFDAARVCWLGTEEDDLPAPFPPCQGPPTVMIVGRLETHRHKGHKELIEAWPEVVRRVPDARLRIVGQGGGLEFYREMARSSPVSGSIDFVGFVPDGEMAEQWATTDVFALPSRQEGFGLVYIEAMRYGIPVIGSTHDAATEVNAEGVTGFNVNLDRPGELAERIVRLLESPRLRQQMGQAGRERWKAHYSFSAFRERFLEHLNQFLLMKK